MLTIIVPTYNSEGKIDRTLDSLSRVLSADDRVSVQFVDDCSRDSTVETLNRFCIEHERASLDVLPQNSGGASAPRNRGLALAKSEYVFFLDSDDVLESENFVRLIDFLAERQFDILRTPIVGEGSDGFTREVDVVRGWRDSLTEYERKRLIVKYQGLTVSCFMRTDLIKGAGIEFDEDRRIGEDIKFVAEVLVRSKDPGYRHLAARRYLRQDEAEASVTQRLSMRDFMEFFMSWADVQSTLGRIGISFIAEHGLAAITYALRQFVWFQDPSGPSDGIGAGRDFVTRYSKEIEKLDLPPRYMEIIEVLRSGDAQDLLGVTRLRIVVAGHDLKFVESLFPYFRARGSLRVDEWSGHSSHDLQLSRDCVKWGDLILCEWMLGAAEWYSNNIRADQRLLVRAHRSELGVDYGERVRLDRVAGVVVISPHGLDDFSDRFGIPRSKLFLVPNLIDSGEFTKRPLTREGPFRSLLMVGVAPSLKRLDAALAILRDLREEGNYVLTILGKDPREIDWLMRIPAEVEYYQACFDYIEKHGLADAVAFGGWSDCRVEDAKHDFLLSVSDYEGNQVAPQEAIASYVIPLVLDRRGADTSYPRRFIFRTPLEIERTILSIAGAEEYRSLFGDAHDWLLKKHGKASVENKWDRLIRKVSM